jgi:hypothetical protein
MKVLVVQKGFCSFEHANLHEILEDLYRYCNLLEIFEDLWISFKKSLFVVPELSEISE